MSRRVQTDEPFRVYSEEEYLAGAGAGRTLAIEAPPADRPRARAALLVVAGCVLGVVIAREAVLGAGSSTRSRPDGSPERGTRVRTARLIAPVSAQERAQSAVRGHTGFERRASDLRRPPLARRPGSLTSRHSPSAASGQRPAEQGKGTAAPAPGSARVAGSPPGRAAAPVPVARAGEPTRRGRPDFTFEHR